ncbi:STAS domain-containing protein [Thiomicrorhabdus xiamenensis]|uniref:STAS domain-containing protein n=1 Tax=Thiomicrorhabdus xiamenensis TaxID=2739063 RepID=A0A7D4SIK5_9GAMM|nr:STAS domain-containing protein [Thiomicrorhabdus xiamenensis]QKI89740.1 STAS domain-containing protein [Thiomicrorhabdus xiamenensis]
MAKPLDANWQQDQATLILPEDLTVSNLDKWLKKNRVLTLPVRKVDFSASRKVDSSVLALIAYWAVKAEQPIELINAGDQVETLLDLYDLEELVVVLS